MNFLAHAWLARDRKELILGGLIADFVKGRQIEQYEPEIVSGIMLHRDIDKFCDNHPTTLQYRESLPNGLRRFAGIILDISYDHILSRDWDNYCNIELSQFSQQTYQILTDNFETLPSNSKEAFSRMIERDWFHRYRNTETLQTALEYTAKRLRKGKALQSFATNISAHLNQIELLFESLWPDVEDHVSEIQK